MKFPIFLTLKNYKLKYLPSDIFSGLIVAAITIPISMGYAQVCGMPAVYGLYGSVFPILLFAMLTTSPQFIFGVDAAPCAVVGGLIATMGITQGSDEAIRLIPIITLFTSLWLLLFSILKAGKLVSFISAPVMGGFISGIAVTIIMMQFPKLLGSASGHGELFDLVLYIVRSFITPNWISFSMGIGTILLIQISRRIVPKFPMAIIVMIIGALSTVLFNIKDYGVVLLDSVNHGLPNFTLPSINLDEITHIFGTSLTVAIVIMAETLLSENNFALKNGYKINDNRELLAFSLGNLVSAFTGGVPINGSVSRTAMSEQFGGKTQVTSLVAGISMICILLFGTDFIGYLPVPILTGIVISALISVIEFDVYKRLKRVSKVDMWIFLGAFFGVLVLGTIYGVAIGVILSFVAVIVKAVNPERTFLGIIPEKEGFFSLKRNRNARPIKNTIIYRFSENLFFGNINTFQNDIENAILPETKQVIVEASGISSIDITAADRIEILKNNLEKMGVKLYITEHIGQVNDQLRKYGLSCLIEDGTIRRTITLVLNELNMYAPYPIEESDDDAKEYTKYTAEQTNSLHEFEWAYGDKAETMMELAVHEIIDNMKKSDYVEDDVNSEDFLDSTDVWIAVGSVDEDDLLCHLEMHIEEISKILHSEETEIEGKIEERRRIIATKIKNTDFDAYNFLLKHRLSVEKYLSSENPNCYKHLNAIRQLRKKELEELDKRIKLAVNQKTKDKLEENISDDKKEN